MDAVLDGITVVDITQNVAGPFCTQILGDLGAEVIKIERPGAGDDCRSWGPPNWDGEAAIFLALNRNKKSVAVDLNHPEGQKLLRALAAEADVLVESLRTGSLEKRDLGYENLKAVNDRLVYCSLSGFGEEGPLKDRPGYDPLIQAYTGLMSITGNPGAPPVRVGTSIMDMGSGLWCALGILGALLERRETGTGQKVTTSLFEVGLSWMSYHVAGYLGSGEVPGKWGSRTSMIAPYEAFETRDDYVFVSAGNDRLFERLCEVVDRPGLSDEERFATNADRVENRDALHEALEEAFRSDTTASWLERLQESGVPCSPINEVDDVVEDPQTRALEMLRDLPHEAIPDLQGVDLPLQMDGRRAEVTSGPPALNAHAFEVLSELDYAPETIRSLAEQEIIGDLPDGAD